MESPDGNGIVGQGHLHVLQLCACGARRWKGGSLVELYSTATLLASTSTVEQRLHPRLADTAWRPFLRDRAIWECCIQYSWIEGLRWLAGISQDHHHR